MFSNNYFTFLHCREKISYELSPGRELPRIVSLYNIGMGWSFCILFPAEYPKIKLSLFMLKMNYRDRKCKLWRLFGLLHLLSCRVFIQTKPLPPWQAFDNWLKSLLKRPRLSFGDSLFNRPSLSVSLGAVKWHPVKITIVWFDLIWFGLVWSGVILLHLYHLGLIWNATFLFTTAEAFLKLNIL